MFILAYITFENFIYDAINNIKHKSLIKDKEQFFIQEVNQNIIFYS